MNDTPRGNRLHIGLFGRRNAGKSSLINAITGQETALVSDFPGTTTDPVYKAMELLPIGPVVFIDTAGLDDTGSLGELRIKKTLQVMDKTDIALMVFSAEYSDFDLEKKWCNELIKRNVPIIGVVNKIDERDIDITELEKNFDFPFIKVSADKRINIGKLKEMIQENAPFDFELSTLLGDILTPKSIVILVMPQDIQAPKNRLILPQVQTIRDILDNNCMALAVKETELRELLASLKRKPDLVITDSQVFNIVSKIVPEDVPLTSFSIIMSRYKGEVGVMAMGAKAIDELKPGDKVLIEEACTHHPLKNDIGRQKLPALLESKAGGKLDIEIKIGQDFPEDLTPYSLILHCGACMLNRKQMITRIIRATEQGIPITNYGMAFAHAQGILDRTTCMFTGKEENKQTAIKTM
ncbi:MAG TPA: [FeFe] hydrogenase H-cluster maturation GTPase HydF [Tepidanaerobacter syntrophicus]|uniref:[FeFe] hydrogenase H-cluster maturation GTPase HydF n=1 Tax=Tepidanaerobacter syntrophicus TaxID=224999 RepID=UPI0017508C27|nr:[FeFe] hydrogenase H-cluster maturation GTPase HydF [Tepidanaerobacter syntrophicus]HHV83428.1 [FeFe] hydrogenase H-cluster maturation GTPase HydF [Tepidanaerobacter syntrophicus]